MTSKAEKRAAALRKAVDVELERRAALNSNTFSVLEIQFENRTLTIPYQPWRPRQRVTVPGQWLQDEELPSPT